MTGAKGSKMVDAHCRISHLVVAAVKDVTSGLGNGYIKSDCVSHHMYMPSTLTGLFVSATLYFSAIVLSWHS